MNDSVALMTGVICVHTFLLLYSKLLVDKAKVWLIYLCAFSGDPCTTEANNRKLLIN